MAERKTFEECERLNDFVPFEFCRSEYATLAVPLRHPHIENFNSYVFPLNAATEMLFEKRRFVDFTGPRLVWVRVS